MTDTEMREKVIKGLECHKRAMYGSIDEHGHACNLCPYKDMDYTCHSRTEGNLIADALALLQAQKSRLMTLEEIQHTDAVWLETHGWVGGDVFETVLRCRSDFEDYVTEFATNDDCDITCVNSKIGIEWRCWTSRPDEKVRAETPWE